MFNLSVFRKQWASYFYLLLDILYHSAIAVVLEDVFCGSFLVLETPILWRKIVQNLFIFVYLFCPENRRASSRKTSITG